MTAPDVPVDADVERRNRRLRNFLVLVAIGLFAMSIVFVGVFRKP